MIITRKWLNEWLEISKVETETLSKTLNSIGLEVDSVSTIKMPKDVVIGKVKSKEKHPDADKLSVCEVDVGDEVLQIVCGAKNVEAGQFVAVAKNGAVLPNGVKIKKAKLRGVESNGMICSSTELGLPKINDGIMPLDESIGELVLGKELSEFLDDDVIEVDITPNRGDCLSIYGIARDLSAALDLDIKEVEIDEEENLLGIGRILSVHTDEITKGAFLYTAFDIDELKENLLMELRLGIAQIHSDIKVIQILNYITHSTGVLLRAYDYECLNSGKKAVLSIKQEKDGKFGIYNENECLSYAGIIQMDKCKVRNESKKVIIEANYTDPLKIAEVLSNDKKLKSDEHFYRSFRGSEPNLTFGIKFLKKFLSSYKGVKLYAGDEQFLPDEEPKIVTFGKELTQMIGQELSREKIVKILKKLNFKVTLNTEQETINVKVPLYRHDISNSNDVCEEIVRIVGIDNIDSKPMEFAEKNRANDSFFKYKKRSLLRQRAISVGFYESVHFVFDDKKYFKEFNFNEIETKLELKNPITSELSTLRSTLVTHLLESAAKNITYGKKSIPLFEIGYVFNKNRQEKENMAFIFSGDISEANILNQAKAKEIDVLSFIAKMKQILGEFELEVVDLKSKLYSPYEAANIIIDGEVIGYLARVHKSVENDFDLPKTYVCEVSFDGIKNDNKIAKAYSKFQACQRDLSLLVPKDTQYSSISRLIDTLNLKELVRFLPIDKYEDEKLAGNSSLTIRFIFQDAQKTLEDEMVNSLIDKILQNLKSELNITIR